LTTYRKEKTRFLSKEKKLNSKEEIEIEIEDDDDARIIFWKE